MSGLDSKQLAERAAIAILNGRRVLVAVPEAERSRVYDMCYEVLHEDMRPGVMITRPAGRRWIEAGQDGRATFVDQVQYAQGFEFDEFMYHQDTPAALIEALLPFLGRGLELQPLAEEDRPPSDAALQWGRLIGSHLLPKLPEEWAVQGDLDVLDCVGGLGVRMRVRQRGQILSDYYVCVLKQGLDINEPDEGMSRVFADELIAQAAAVFSRAMETQP